MSGTPHPPSVRVLDALDGRTIIELGVVFLRESRKYFNHAVFGDNPQYDSQRAVNAVMALNHETVHYLQGLTSPFLIEHGNELLKFANALVRSSGDDDRSAFEYFASEFTQKYITLDEAGPYGFSLRDMLESAASIEGFRLTDRTPSLSRYKAYVRDFHVGASGAVYDRWFSYIAGILGEETAFIYLAPLTWLAFQADSPLIAAANVVNRFLAHHREAKNAETLEQVIVALNLGVSVIDGLLQVRSGPQYYTVALENLEWVSQKVGRLRLAEIAAWPSRYLSSKTADVDVDALMPPFLVFSAASGDSFGVELRGFARVSQDFVVHSLRMAADLGAAARLTVLKQKTDVHLICYHQARCPHAPSRLCHGYFRPPAVDRDPASCQFISRFVELASVPPAVAWARHQA